MCQCHGIRRFLGVTQRPCLTLDSVEASKDITAQFDVKEIDSKVLTCQGFSCRRSNYQQVKRNKIQDIIWVKLDLPWYKRDLDP